jgi:hypothetical protein
VAVVVERADIAVITGVKAVEVEKFLLEREEVLPQTLP